MISREFFTYMNLITCLECAITCLISVMTLLATLKYPSMTALLICGFSFHFLPINFIYIIEPKSCPVYIIHGTDDDIVPFYHGESLFNLLPDACKTVPFWARGERNHTSMCLMIVLSRLSY